MECSNEDRTPVDESTIYTSREAGFDDINFDKVYLIDIDTCHELKFDDAKADDVYMGEISREHEFFYTAVIKDNNAFMNEFSKAINSELKGL